MCRTREHTGTVLSCRSQPISPRSSDYRVSNLGLAVGGEQQRATRRSVQPTKRKTVRRNKEAKAAANIRVGTKHGEIEEKRGELEGEKGKRGDEKRLRLVAGGGGGVEMY